MNPDQPNSDVATDGWRGFVTAGDYESARSVALQAAHSRRPTRAAPLPPAQLRGLPPVFVPIVAPPLRALASSSIGADAAAAVAHLIASMTLCVVSRRSAHGA